MNENLIITHARVVTPLGESALSGKTMSQLHVIEDATVEVTKGMITYVGETRAEDAENSYGMMRDDNYCRIDVAGHCLLPGFVDSHTHLVFGGERAEEFSWRLKGESYMSIMQRGGGIASTVKATRNTCFNDLILNAERLLRRMSRMGVTTVEAKSGYGLDCDTELLMLRVLAELNRNPRRRLDIIPTFLGAHAVPPEFSGKADEYIRFIIEKVLPKVAEEGLADFCDIFCEEGVFSLDQSRRLLQAAADRGLWLKIHADEITPLGGAGLAAELKATSADHLLHIADEDIPRMAQSGVVATLLPLTAFALKEDYAPARKLIDAGCAVALATDLNPGSCFSGSIPLTIALACIHMQMSIEEVITALTLNGAAALNQAHAVGTIEVGKQGDMVLLNSSNYHMLPYYVGMNCVAATIKSGRLYYNEE